MPPRVSVLLNSYNQAAYVQEAVESVLAQTCDDFELIVTDNGSTDESPRILAEYGSHSRVRLNLRQDNDTVSRRFNQAVAMARGEFVCFLYSDDWYLPHKIERQLQLFDSLPSDYGLVYAPLKVFNQLTRSSWILPTVRMGDDALISLLNPNYQGSIDMISPMIRRECFVRHPFLDDVFAEGEAIFLRIALTHRFHEDPEPVSVMRDTGENRGKAVRKNLEMHWRTLETLESDPTFDRQRYGRHLKAYESAVLRNTAWCNLRCNGPAQWSYRQYLRSIRLSPAYAFHKRFFGGLIFGLLPSGARMKINEYLNTKWAVQANMTQVDNYGGSSV